MSVAQTSHKRASVSQGAIARYYQASGRAVAGSNFGAMCEAASLVTHASIECRACEGMGFKVLEVEELERWQKRVTESKPEHRDQLRTRLRDESECKVCRGSGYTTPKRSDRASAMDGLWTTVRCSRCRGCGEVVAPPVPTSPEATRKAIAAGRAVGGLNPTDHSAESQDACEYCGGLSYIIPVTVKEKGSSKSGKPPKRESGPGGEDITTEDVATASWIDEDTMAEFGRVSRLVDAVRRQDPTAADAFAAYNGHDGDKWGAHRWGRLFALWPLTRAGAQLAQESAAKSKGRHAFLLRPIDLVASEREAEARTSTPNPRRRALIGQADKQARELWRNALATLRVVEAASA